MKNVLIVTLLYALGYLGYRVCTYNALYGIIFGFVVGCFGVLVLNYLDYTSGERK